MIIIILNIVTMAVIYDGISTDSTDILRLINLVFTSIFILEAFVKLIALGLSNYFKSSWNAFDFTVVLLSVIDILMDALGK